MTVLSPPAPAAASTRGEDLRVSLSPNDGISPAHLRSSRAETCAGNSPEHELRECIDFMNALVELALLGGAAAVAEFQAKQRATTVAKREESWRLSEGMLRRLH